MKIILLFSFLFSQILFANDFSVCGEYSVKGVVRAREKSVVLMVNEKTFSEYIISFRAPEDALQLALYVDQPVEANLLLLKKFNGTIGVADKLERTEVRVPNPINSLDTGFFLNRKIPCQN
jgi:hypothetical protein